MEGHWKDWVDYGITALDEPYERMHYPLSIAIEYMKKGYAFARKNWNGKNMWVTYSPGSGMLPAIQFWSKANREYALTRGGSAAVLPCLTMRVQSGEILMGWLASQTDLIANDWFWVKEAV